MKFFENISQGFFCFVNFNDTPKRSEIEYTTRNERVPEGGGGLMLGGGGWEQ